MIRAHCAACGYFVPNAPERTYQQEYEADTRPEARGFINRLLWTWNPQAFKRPAPDSIEHYVDALTDANNQAGRCVRFPKSQKVSRDYGCGEFAPKASPDPRDDGEK